MSLELSGDRVLVLGLGISGRSAARFCAERGAQVVAADERAAAELDDLDALTSHPAIELRVGSAFPEAAGFDLIVPSPGIPRARWAGAPGRVWGDIELSGRALAIPFAAVTGTNGKSTTCLMAQAMLRSAGLRARAAGNVGLPALSLVGEPLDAAVLEVSSFQLEATEAFRPKVAVILNITPDHLDRHGNFADYVAAKRRILESQEASDVAVLGVDDPLLRELSTRVKAQLLPFSARQPLETGVYLDGAALVLRDGAAEQRISLDGFEPTSAHDWENAAAALAIVHALGADAREAARALASFRGLPHRCELVAEVGGVRYVNDSKATNPGAAERALVGQGRPVVWIAGGRDKGLDFASLADAAADNARAVLLIGEAAASIALALGDRIDCQRCDSLDDAVERAARMAEPGDCVLLAPACASFDQFHSFEERGQRFREAVTAQTSRPRGGTR